MIAKKGQDVRKLREFTNSKIIATIGPATNKQSTLKKAIKAGIDVCRLDFSQGTHEEHAVTFDLIRKVDEEIAILADLSGPIIQTGEIKEGVKLQKGRKFILSADYEIPGNSRRVGISYPQLPSETKKGHTIFIDDGKLRLEVTDSNEQEISCKVIEGGNLSSKKKINVPGVPISLYTPSEKDLQDIAFCRKLGVDFFAASFVRRPDDIARIREISRAQSEQRIAIDGFAAIDLGAKRVHVISKIEHEDAICNYDEILAVTDGILIARGELGIQTSPESVPLIQKDLVERANRAGVVSIIATEMLESMISNPRPTRAEASDVANAILDGADALLLSGETAIGKYPTKAVEYMDMIICIAETGVKGREPYWIADVVEPERAEAVAYAACRAAKIIGAKTILATTRSGKTPRILSKYRPQQHLVAATPFQSVARELRIVWGVTGITMPVAQTTDQMIYGAVAAAHKRGLVDEMEEIVVVGGTLLGYPNVTNDVQILNVFDVLSYAPLYETPE
jgi:pyruvate kinase